MPTVALIEDDSLVRLAYARTLEHAGYRVLTASNGREGAHLVREFRPDLVLCDVNMPDQDGLSVLQVMHEDPELSSIPLVLMTGNTHGLDTRGGMNLGADDFLAKPIGRDDLLRCVESRIRRAKKQQTAALRSVERLRSDLQRLLPHELFTPLTGILGLADILRDPSTQLGTSESRELAEDIHMSAKRLHRTLRNYLLALDFDRNPSSPSHPEVSDPPAIHSAILHGLQLASDRHKRRTDLVASLADTRMHVDPAELALITEELVENACAYSRPGSRIEVRLSASCCLRISDRGRGMTKGQINQIGEFRQFDRKQHEQQGLGLGLILVQKLAERNLATFSMESLPSQGTVVQLQFIPSPPPP
jgi:signal transduction histidine kinase